MKSAIYALLAVALTATATRAQDKPPDPVENATMHIWKIGITPTVLLRDIGRDYNVYNEATDPKQDYTATLSSKADVFFHPGPLLVSYTSSSDFIYYKKYKDQRGGNSAQGVRLEFTFGPLRPSFSVGAGDGKDRINREIDTRVRHHETTYSAGLGVQILDPLSASVTVKHVKGTFPDATEYRGERLDIPLNSNGDSLEGGVAFAVTPLTTVGFVVGTDRSHFPLSPDRDSHSLRITPRVTFSPLAMLQGTASLGYRRFVSDSKRLEPFSGFLATLGLGTTIADRHRVDVLFSRDISYSYDKTAPYYVETGAQVTWAFALFGPIDLRLTAGRSRLNYRSPSLTAANDDDINNNYGFGVIYRLRETLRFGLNGEWRDRRSERAFDRTYDNHRVFANITWGK